MLSTPSCPERRAPWGRPAWRGVGVSVCRTTAVCATTAHRTPRGGTTPHGGGRWSSLCGGDEGRGDVMWCDAMWCDVRWCDVMWCEMMWDDVRWDEMRWNEMKCCDVMEWKKKYFSKKEWFIEWDKEGEIRGNYQWEKERGTKEKEEERILSIFPFSKASKSFSVFG